MKFKKGDLVYIREKNHNSFYGWFIKRKTGFGVITEARKGYSSHDIYWIKILIPNNLNSKPIVFYENDLKLARMESLSQEEIDSIMVEML